MRKILLLLMVSLMTIAISAAPDAFAQQAQGQIQGQGQQIAGDFGVQDSFNSDGSTIFPNAGSIEYPNAPAHFGGPNYRTHGPNFASVKTLLMYNDQFRVVWEDADEEASLKEAIIGLIRRVKFRRATNHDVDVRIQKLQHWKPDQRYNRYDTISAGFEKVEGDVKVLAEGTIIANDMDVTSSMVMVEAILQAYATGGNYVHVISEGSQKELHSFGWGIGLSYTQASVNDAGDIGQVASGGTGISGGNARYDSLPWLQFFVLEVPVIEPRQ